MRRRRIAWTGVLVVYAGAIFALSGLPLDVARSPIPFLRVDALLHAAEFAAFFLLARRAAGATGVALVLTGAYAGTDELHQAFVPARAASVVDFGFDLLGALAAAIVRNGLARARLLPRFRRLILAIRGSGKEQGN